MRSFGLILAFLDFVLIGFGVGAAGTSLAGTFSPQRSPPERRPAAATIVWLNDDRRHGG